MAYSVESNLIEKAPPYYLTHAKAENNKPLHMKNHAHIGGVFLRNNRDWLQ
jgi:hypothetical protein